ncbi:cysteine desulfurase [Bryocella elongata]|uniref:cysteine desulfurase n=1 Tax=Bryocella elongata TaxID=863522 RepID=A0A1H5ZH58_9BACT|nr:cysteine desulfurase family protein [Bryocella elongata]SEG35582.1 cysteine desulfurase [Bryocella elongata]
MDRIDLDANATTPVAPEVFEAMRPYFLQAHGNPSSAHAAGQRTRAAVDRARQQVAKLLHCVTKEIIFTSGGTESDNLALRGVLEPFLDRRLDAHLVTTQIEHHAVLYAAEALHRRRIGLTCVAPTRDGVIDPTAFEAALTPKTVLVSIMLANNETGAIQPVGKLARIAKQYNPAILVHTDAVQAAGKLPLDMSGEFKNVDLLSLSGHKLYGPQGTGVLFAREGLHLAPLFHGGPHERQRRAGTENVAGIVGLGKAAELAAEWLSDVSRISHLESLRNRLEQGVLAALPGTIVNAASAPRVANTTNLQFPGVDAESLLIALDLAGINASFGAACQSGATEPSHVLLAMGLTDAEARSSLRFSLSRYTTSEDIDRALTIIAAAVRRQRSLSPALTR